MLKNKKLIFVAGGVVVLILIVVGIYFFVSRKNASLSQGPTGDQIEVIPTIMPEEIGLRIQVRSDKKYVKFTIDKPAGIDKIEYAITYDFLSDGNVLTQALAGDLTKADIKDGKLGIDYRELGTCSTGGKCRFDEGITSIKVILKITKSNGKIYQVEKSTEL